MNRLEQYINDHKNLFEEEPETGHFERFQEKITLCKEVSRHVSITKVLRWVTSVAAAIAILTMAGVIWQNAGKQDRMMLCENTVNMKICYLEKMNLIAGEIETLISNFDQWDRQQVMDDVQNIIAEVDGNFDSELPEELPCDVAKAILADYYRRNLESLEMIVKGIRN